jgi:hypothetical protein
LPAGEAAGDDLTVLACWHCDFASGRRGCDRCAKCAGTGSVFWNYGRSYPYTPDGEKRARKG